MIEKIAKIYQRRSTFFMIGGPCSFGERSTKKLLIVVIFFGSFLLTNTVKANTYYIDFTNGSDSNNGLTVDTAWKYSPGMTSCSSNCLATTLNAGDSILFKRGETWTEGLQVNSSGLLNNVITFDAYGSGNKPLIDVSADLSSAYGIKLLNINYVALNNLAIKGSGGDGAFVASGISGTDGAGFTVLVTEMDVLSNYGASGGSDCYSLADSAKVEFRNITATGCRANPPDASSDQAMTTHTDAYAKVYGATFSDSEYWAVNTLNSKIELHNIVATSALSQGFTLGLDVTSSGWIKVYDSTITTSGSGALGGSGGSGGQLLIDNSTITLGSSGTAYQRSETTISSSTINVTSSERLIVFGSGRFNIANNTINNSTASSYLFAITTGSGVLALYNNIVTPGAVALMRVINSTGRVDVYYNIFKNVSGTNVLYSDPNSSTRFYVYNNIFYSSTLSGIAVRRGNTPGNEIELKNNIFYNITDPIHYTGGSPVISNNVYYNSFNEGGVGSLVSDPLFINHGTNFDLQFASPVIDSGENVGFVGDHLSNPLYGTPDIGAYEYQPPYTLGTHDIDPTGGIRIYGDGKYRYTTATSSTETVDLDINPPEGRWSYTASTTRPEWLNIVDITWTNDLKQWTASSTTATTTVYTIGDLTPNTYYTIAVDGLASTTQQANSSGVITYTYSGGYSAHTFSVTPDTTGPASFSLISPTNGASVSPNLSFSWNSATDSGSGFSHYRLYIDGILHTDNILNTSAEATNLSCGTHTWYVRAIDNQNNSTDSSTNNFTVDCASSGGSSVASRIKNLKAMGNNKLAQELERQYSLVPIEKSSTSTNYFKRNLKVGSTGEDVRQLQIFLNNNGFTISNKGLGSKGQETSYFGLLTKSAVIRFQEFYAKDILEKQGLFKGTGYVGKNTLKRVNDLMKINSY